MGTQLDDQVSAHKLQNQKWEKPFPWERQGDQRLENEEGKRE